MPSAKLLKALPYWYDTGADDFYNAGSPAELVDEAHLEISDSRDEVRKKIEKMLFESMTFADHEGLSLDDEVDEFTDREKQKLFEEWVKGWASAASSSCVDYLKREEERRKEDEEDY